MLNSACPELVNSTGLDKVHHQTWNLGQSEHCSRVHVIILSLSNPPHLHHWHSPPSACRPPAWTFSSTSSFFHFSHPPLHHNLSVPSVFSSSFFSSSVHSDPFTYAAEAVEESIPNSNPFITLPVVDVHLSTASSDAGSLSSRTPSHEVFGGIVLLHLLLSFLCRFHFMLTRLNVSQIFLCCWWFHPVIYKEWVRRWVYFRAVGKETEEMPELVLWSVVRTFSLMTLFSHSSKTWHAALLQIFVPNVYFLIS